MMHLDLALLDLEKRTDNGGGFNDSERGRPRPSVGEPWKGKMTEQEFG
jgi:hypothetical protein